MQTVTRNVCGSQTIGIESLCETTVHGRLDPGGLRWEAADEPVTKALEMGALSDVALTRSLVAGEITAGDRAVIRSAAWCQHPVS